MDQTYTHTLFEKEVRADISLHRYQCHMHKEMTISFTLQSTWLQKYDSRRFDVWGSSMIMMLIELCAKCERPTFTGSVSNPLSAS